MAKFFVGQRVKTVRFPRKERTSAKNHGVGLGEEGVVMGTTSIPNLGFRGRSGDDLSVHIFRRGVMGMAPAYCFEPIRPEGERAGQSDLCKPLDHLLSRLKGVEV